MNKVSEGQRGKACQPLKGPIGFNLPTWTTVGDQITSNRKPSQTQWAHFTGLALENVFKESRGRFSTDFPGLHVHKYSDRTY